MDTCSICLQELKNNEPLQTFSCNHTFHFTCFRDMIFHNNEGMFLECPLCRDHNTNITKPFRDPKQNIQILTLDESRCSCMTKKGRKCKHNRKLLNYGYCHVHNKEVLTENLYPLMERYIYLIMWQKNTLRTKLYLIDLGKKILMKYCNTGDSNVEDVLQYFYQYIAIHSVKSVKDYQRMYEYYDFTFPPETWIQDCLEKKIII
jgi:hypothetical protein